MKSKKKYTAKKRMREFNEQEEAETFRFKFHAKAISAISASKAASEKRAQIQRNRFGPKSI